MRSPTPRRFCCDEDLARIGYDGLNADNDLQKWRSGQLHPVTQELIDEVAAQGIDDAALLDVGAGVGAVHLTLLERGAASAVDVDASRDYLATARAEADRRGLAGRVDYRYGDVVELAAELARPDVVTLDSVICCYPYLGAILDAVLRHRPRIVGLTYPRDVWWMRVYMLAYNAMSAVRRSPARYFIHRHAELERHMTDAGYRIVHHGGIRPWRVLVYRLAA